MSPEKINTILQQEASELLESTNLLKTLGKIGHVELGGSFVYGTMIDEDIDIAVIVDKEKLNYKFRKNVMNELLNIKDLDGIAMTDRHHNPKSGAPKGIWFGPLIWHNQNKWNIDIWLVTQNERYSHHNSPLHKRMLSITEEQRKIILEIKNQLLKKGLKNKGITSVEIYNAVLDSNITNLSDYLKYSQKSD